MEGQKAGMPAGWKSQKLAGQHASRMALKQVNMTAGWQKAGW
jgi:hypothetical protein